jgi:preprotein translocase subunit SecE
MNRLTIYIREAYDELLHKVSWPTWDELQESAVVVLVASLLIGLVVLGMDQLSNTVLKFIYKAIIG